MHEISSTPPPPSAPPPPQAPAEAPFGAPLSPAELNNITTFGESVIDDVSVNDIPINKVEVLSNRLVPGSDGSIEHVVLANNAITVIRSTPLRGRVRISSDNVHVGGVSCKILLTGLEARVETVRHLVGGASLVYGALFLSKQRTTPIKKYKTITVGSPTSVVQALIEDHCAAEPSPHLKALAAELDGMFLPYDKLSGPLAS